MGEDQRWEKFGEEYFGWTAKHDTHFKNKRTMANIGGGELGSGRTCSIRRRMT